MGFIRSFFYALCGIKAALSERNFRVHCIAVLFVLTLAPVFLGTSVRAAVLIIFCGLVPALELVNSAVERLCNLVTKEHSPEIKHIKDISAGAVLVAAVASVAVFVLFLLDGGWAAVLTYSKANIWYPALLFAELLLLMPALKTKRK